MWNRFFFFFLPTLWFCFEVFCSRTVDLCQYNQPCQHIIYEPTVKLKVSFYLSTKIHIIYLQYLYIRDALLCCWVFVFSLEIHRIIRGSAQTCINGSTCGRGGARNQYIWIPSSPSSPCRPLCCCTFHQFSGKRVSLNGVVRCDGMYLLYVVEGRGGVGGWRTGWFGCSWGFGSLEALLIWAVGTWTEWLGSWGADFRLSTSCLHFFSPTFFFLTPPFPSPFPPPAPPHAAVPLSVKRTKG